MPTISGRFGQIAEVGASAWSAGRIVGSGCPWSERSTVSRCWRSAPAPVVRWFGGKACSCSSARRIAVVSWLWKLAVRCETSALAKAFASCAARTADVSWTVTSTMSLAPTACACSAATSESRERVSPSSVRTASATCGDRSITAALAAAVRLPPVSRSSPRPRYVGSDDETGETISWEVAWYRSAAVYA